MVISQEYGDIVYSSDHNTEVHFRTLEDLDNPKDPDFIRFWNACKFGDLEGVNEGFRAGFDINKDDERSSAITWAIALDQKEVFKLLLERPDININNTREASVLHAACIQNKPWAVSALTSDPRLTTINLKDKGGDTPLMAAVFQGHEEVVKIMLEIEEVDLDTKDNTGKSLFTIARYDISNLKHLTNI